MRLTLLTTLVAFGAVACGGEKKADASQAQAATPAPAAATPAAPAAEPAAAVVEVKMTGNGTTKAHDIAFYADSIPKGAADVLKKGMPNQMMDLASPFLQQPNEKYDVSFAGAPAGTYKGYCLPHVALGMKVTITVK